MFDDWWYPGHPVQVACTQDLVPQASLFPDGFGPVRQEYQHLMLYMMVFCPDNAFQRRDPSLKWLTSNQVTETNTTFVTPAPASAQAAFTALLQKGVSQGMSTFEIDFMGTNFMAVPYFRQQVDAYQAWLDGMDAAAMATGVPIQWCTAQPADLMAARLKKKKTE